MKRKMIGIVLLSAAVLFLGMATKEEVPYIQARQKNEKIRTEYTDIPDEAEEGDGPAGETERNIGFPVLQELNPDIIGWLYIPGTPIDYPVLKNPYDNYYLSHDFTGEYSEIGSVFMQESGDGTFSASHNILYAHNLMDDQMFGSLPDYADQDVRDSQPYIYLYLPGQTLCCTIYSAYECMDGTGTYQMTYADSQDFAGWIDMTVEASNYPAVIPKQTDRILTLSTCADEGNARFVVHSVIETADQ